MERQKNNAEWREVYLDDLGHVKALRKGVIMSLFILIMSFCISFYYSKTILDFILSEGRTIGYTFVYLSPIEVMGEQIKVSFIVALIVTMPVIITQFLLFIKPAIDGPISVLIKIFVYALILFVLGALFSYLVLMPFTFKMFYQIGLETNIMDQISVQKYVDLYIVLVVMLGVVFETPLVAAFLAKIGLINSKAMAKGRPVAIIIIMTISNIITPTTDILTATIVDVPMIILYEISIIVCKNIEKKKEVKRKAAES